MPSSVRDTTLLDDVSVGNTLDWLTRTVPAFAWRDIDGIPNIRPKDAWTSADDLLNMPLAPLQVSAVDVSGAGLELFFGDPPSGPDVPKFDFDLTFPGGPVLNGLNSIVRAAHAAGWDAVTVAHPRNRDGDPVAAVVGIRYSGHKGAGGSEFVLTAKTLAKRQ
ncbi:MAG: hypothetical protein ACRD1V_02925 [Vicinamibacterales bacterium]